MLKKDLNFKICGQKKILIHLLIEKRALNIHLHLSSWSRHCLLVTICGLCYTDRFLSSILQSIIAQLSREFTMTSHGAFNYFLGISATRSSQGPFLYRRKYDSKSLERANMLRFNPNRTLAEITHKIDAIVPLVVD